MLRHREQRTQPQNVSPRRARCRARQRHRYRAARLPFEQQQLDRQQHRRDRRGERGRHARRRARHQQRLSFRRGQVKQLRDHRPDRAARHDDRAFGAERAARPDRDRRRDRLQHRQPRLHLAAVDQNRFERFRNAVTANAFRAVARHEADDQAAAYRNQHREPAQVVSGRRDESRAHSPVVKEIGEEPDQAQQCPCDERAQDPDADRQHRNRNDARRRGEIAQRFRIVLRVYSRRRLLSADAAAPIPAYAPVRDPSVPAPSGAPAPVYAGSRGPPASAGPTPRACLRCRNAARPRPALSSRLTSSTAL